MKINPDNADAWNNKGLVLDWIGKHNQALECFERVLTKYPDNGKAWYGKGTSLYSFGKQDEADQCFAQARKLGLTHSRYETRPNPFEKSFRNFSAAFLCTCMEDPQIIVTSAY